jgi:HlyD family secretion protein
MNRVAVIKLAVVLAIFSSALVAATHGAGRLNAAEGLGEKQWRAVAPGRIESASGEIKLMSAIVGRVADILVSTNDQVFAGELLIRLDEADARGRLTKARAQFAMQKRARNDEVVSGKAAQRRKAEDAVADAENAVFEAQTALDLITARHRGLASQAAVDDARTKLARMQDQLKAKQMELRKLEAQSGVPLPTQGEGQFNVARAELSGAQAAFEKTRIRAPIDGRVLKVNARPGEMVGPSSAQPLLLFADVSRLQIRAEVDEADFSEISLGEAVVVRATAFPDRDFSGKVSFVSPMVGSPRINTGKAEDTKVVEVFAELSDPGPLAVGMKLDVYFMAEGQRGPTH